MSRAIISVLALVLSGGIVLACTCDEQCKDGEVYSDEAEMCIAEDAPTS